MSVPKPRNAPFPLKRIIAVLVLVASVFAAAALFLPKTASAKGVFGLNKTQTQQIQAIQNYLNAISSMRARFIQTTNQGDFSQGAFYMARPGRMRVVYDPPTPILIVSNGSWVMYKNTELDQLSFVPLSRTPAGLFIGKHVNFFSKDLIISAYEHKAGAIRLSVKRANDPTGGTLTLVFSDTPLQLRKWSVIDAQRIVTTVSLLDPQFGTTLSDNLFKIESGTTGRRLK